ncbi:MAG TPA: RNA polymerase sigma factor [Patescibacteria group bacterium]|nr:RNA polymerase sigma factor [Patescibacteria group bacterium]
MIPVIKNTILVSKIKAGDSDAFGRVYDEHVDAIYRFVLYKVSHNAEAEDITSEVFLKTWTYIREGNHVQNIRALLFRIARNLVIDYYRANKNRIHIAYEELADVLVTDIDSADREMYQKEIQEFLEQGLNTLKDEYKDVLLLRYVEGLSISEIAHIMDRTNGACRVLLHRAISALKKIKNDFNE